MTEAAAPVEAASTREPSPGVAGGWRLRAELRLLRRLGGLLQGQLIHVAGACVTFVVAGGTVLALGVTLRQFVDHGVHRTLRALDGVAAEMAALVVVYALAAYGRALLTGLIGDRVSHELRKRTLKKLLQHGPAFFEERGPHRIWSEAAADAAQVQTATATALAACRSAVILAGGVIMMAWTNLVLTSGVFVLAPVITLAMFRLHAALREVAHRAQRATTEAEACAYESLAQIRTVKAFSQEKRIGDAFDALSDRALARWRARNHLQGLVTSGSILLIFGAAVLLAWIAGNQIATGRASEGVMTAFLFYAVATANAGAGLADAAGQLQRGLGAAERVFVLLDSPVEIAAPPSPCRLPPRAKGLIEFKDVRFSYRRPGRDVLNGFSLRIEPGRSLALVGRSGAGKSTLFNLLLRLFDPTGGSVAVDGLDLRTLSPEDLRRHIALVPQDHALFEGSIRSNIQYGDESASQADVERAAEAAMVQDFAAALSEGLDTPVGHRGEKLSGGQRQRVAIARALLRKPSILLLDEATNALDPHAIRHIQDGMMRLSAGATTLLIAHQLSTALQADEIAMVADGRVVGRGPHEELLRTLPDYERWVVIGSS